MLLDPAPRGANVADHKQSGDRGRMPSPLVGDLKGKTLLSVERHERRLDVRHDRLHLDDQDDARLRVECKDVDRAPLAKDVEGHLGRHQPAGDAQDPNDLFDDRGVIRIEQPIRFRSRSALNPRPKVTSSTRRG